MLRRGASIVRIGSETRLHTNSPNTLTKVYTSLSSKTTTINNNIKERKKKKYKKAKTFDYVRTFGRGIFFKPLIQDTLICASQ